VLDVVTGAMLGQFCIYCFPERLEQSGKFKSSATSSSRLTKTASAYIPAHRSLFISTPNLRIARHCATGSAALSLLAMLLGSWAWLLLWPALSLAIMSTAYLKGNGNVFRKSEGRIPVSSRVTLGAYLFGMFVRRLFYKNRFPAWREIAPGIYCGRLPTRTDITALKALGITAVLDMTAEHSETRAFLVTDSQPTMRRAEKSGYLNNTIEYLNVPVLDLTQPSREQLEIAAAFIGGHCSQGRVYVHCALGISRSLSAVTAYQRWKES